MLGSLGRFTQQLHAIATIDDVAARVTALREAADDLTAELRDSAMRRTPVPVAVTHPRLAAS